MNECNALIKFFPRRHLFCLFISRTEGKIRMNNMQEDNLSRVLCTKSGMQLNIKTTKTLQNGVSKCLHKSTRITSSFQNNKHNNCFCSCPETELNFSYIIALWRVSVGVAECRCDSNSKRSLFRACLQLSADFDYTSSVKGF